MDELVIEGKKYISSKRASEITGYAKDYVGQLARLGKVPATRIGRAWYVDEVALLLHESSGVEGDAQGAEALEEAVSHEVPIRREREEEKKIPSVSHALFRKERSLPSTWDSVLYFPDDRMLFPMAFSESITACVDGLAAQNKDISSSQENDIRIRILQAKTGISSARHAPHALKSFESRPKEKEMQKTKAPRVTRKQRKVILYGLLAFSASSFAILLLGSGLLVASHITIAPQSDLYIANAYLSYEYAKETFLQIPSIQAGYTGLKDFLLFLVNSPQELFLKGIDFLKKLPNLV